MPRTRSQGDSNAAKVFTILEEALLIDNLTLIVGGTSCDMYRNRCGLYNET